MTITVSVVGFSGEQYYIQVEPATDTVDLLKGKASQAIGHPVEDLMTADGSVMRPPHVRIDNFRLEEGSTITASFGIFEAITDGLHIRVYPEARYDPTEKIFPRCVPPCDWIYEHGQQGPGPSFCQWKYSASAPFNMQVLLNAFQDEPWEQRKLEELLSREDRVTCRMLSASWHVEDMPQLAGGVKMVEATFAGHVAVMHVRGVHERANGPRPSNSSHCGTVDGCRGCGLDERCLHGDSTVTDERCQLQ